jgi:hypothetical protein
MTIKPSSAYSTVPPPYRRATSAKRSISAVMTSRRLSMSKADARSIERTTSAKSTFTCLYSADAVTGSSRVPHSLQNLPVECAPQAPHITFHGGRSTAAIRAGVHITNRVTAWSAMSANTSKPKGERTDGLAW